MKRKLTAYEKNLIEMTFTSIINTIILLFASLASGSAIGMQTDMVPIFSFFCYFFLAVNFACMMIINKKKKILFYKFLLFVVIYLAFGVAVFFAPNYILIYYIITAVYIGLIIINRITVLIYNHKIGSIIISSIILLASALLLIGIVVPLSLENELTPYVIYLLFGLTTLTIIATSFLKIMQIIFSRFKTRALIRVLRKTYAIEVLYGLVILIVAISIMLMLYEPSMESFGDALWYCFAIVTTIGFGDIYATSLIGRLLSVILGIYGLVVVALITSIIVNLYQESSSRESKEKEEERDFLDEISDEIQEENHEDNKDK